MNILRLGVPIAALCLTSAAPSLADTTGTVVKPDSTAATISDRPEAVRSAPPRDNSPPPQDSTIRELDRMVVTATRTERDVADIPVSISVVGRSTIELAPARNVTDLLMNEAGVLVKRVVGMGEGIPGDIIIRGVPGAFAAARVLVLVDGVPTNVSGTPFMLLNEVPLEAIERVEVVRGPFSSLYGANALGGVINIITRQPTRPQQVSGHVGGLPGAFIDLSLWNGGAFDQLQYSVVGGYRYTDNWTMRDSVLVRNGDITVNAPTDNHRYRQAQALGRLRFWLTDDLCLGLQARYFSSDLGFGRSRDHLAATMNMAAPYKVLAAPSLDWTPSDIADVSVSGFVRRLVGEFDNVSYDSTLIHDIDTSSVPFDTSYGVSVPSTWRSYVDDGLVEARATFELGQYNTVTAGADYLYNQVRYGDTKNRETGDVVVEGYERSISNTGLYVQDEVRLFGWLNALPSVRLDHHSLAGLVVSPKLACSFKPHKRIRPRFSIGRAFRSPNLIELYLPAQELLSGVTMLPSPDLDPETLNAIDLGFDFEVATILTGSFSGFYNKMTDLISPKIMPDPINRRVYISHRNVSDAWSAGAEADMSLHLPAWVHWDVAYAFTESRDVTIDRRLDYVPLHSLTFGATVDKRLGPVRLQATITENFVDGREYVEWQTSNYAGIDSTETGLWIPESVALKNYWRTDLSLRCGFVKDHAWVKLEVQNLFDRRYEESGGTYAPGRLVVLTVGGEY